MVIIYILFVELESPMLNAKLQIKGHMVPEEMMFEGFNHIWVCNLGHVSSTNFKLLYPLLPWGPHKEAPHEIWL